MYGAFINGCPAFAGLVKVRTTADTLHLTKESEIASGRAGRQFFIERAPIRLAYLVSTNGLDIEVQRLNDDGNPVCTMYSRIDQLMEGEFGEAMSDGRLFTEALYS
jgi:hypothetical protein